MKYITSLLATSILATATHANDNRNLASLAEKWAIDDPTFAYDSLGFSLAYKINRYIIDNDALKMVQWSIWDENCKPTDGSAGHLVWDHEDPVNGPGNQDGLKSVNATGDNMVISYPQITSESTTNATYTLGIQIDTTKITSNTFLYTEYTVDNQLTAEIRFCNRFELWTPATLVNGDTNPTPFEVNFLETLVTLTVDLTDGFEIGSIAVEPKDRVVRTANQVYQVVGFLCDNQNDVLGSAELGRARSQGEVVRVCVEPDPDAIADQIKMRSIDSFTFTRDAFSQVAIVGGAEAPNLLTTYTPSACRGYQTCWFETILFANFYTSVGAVEGSGVASMQFGTAQSRRRNLRSLQDGEDEVAAAAEFELEFDVAATDANGSDASTMGMMLAGWFAGVMGVTMMTMMM